MSSMGEIKIFLTKDLLIVIEMVSKFAVENGFSILNLDYSPIKGPEGNIEYLIHLKNSNEGYTFNEEDYKKQIIKVVEDSHKLNH